MKLAQTLTPDNENITLYMVKTAFGNIEIKRSDQQTWLMVDNVVQTAIENTPPYRSLLPHNYIMLLPLNYDLEPKSILELGGGGLFINRYLHMTRPTIHVKSIESCHNTIQAVEKYFPKTPTLDVVHMDAWDYLAHPSNERETFDWIIIDLFQGANSFLSRAKKSIFTEVASLLDKNGWLIINILDTSEDNINAINQEIAEVFGQISCRFAVPNMVNQIMMFKQGERFHFPAEIQQHDLNAQHKSVT